MLKAHAIWHSMQTQEWEYYRSGSGTKEKSWRDRRVNGQDENKLKLNGLIAFILSKLPLTFQLFLSQSEGTLKDAHRRKEKR